jgi:predicted protein tyrosine phosphatase
MKIIALSKEEAEEISSKLDVPHAIISITSPGNPKAEFAHNPLKVGVLPLEFFDVDFSDERMSHSRAEILKLYGHGKFTEEQARSIIDFALNMQNKIKLLVCHCGAGVSRSAGVAGALSLILNGSDKDIFNNPRYIPNMFVYQTILNEHFGEITRKRMKEDERIREA